MQVLERQEIRLVESDLIAVESELYRKGLPEPKVRSAGVHVSTILKYIALATGELRFTCPYCQVVAKLKCSKCGLPYQWGATGVQEDFEEEFPLRMAVGMAWELWAQGIWPDLLWQPGEIERDGIVGSPDGLTSEFYVPLGNGAVHDFGVGLLEEFKFTWKSSRNRHDAIQGEWLWMRQLMSYCAMWGLKYARLHVLWANGSYDWKGGNSGPVYNTYLIGFSGQELERHWSMMISNKEKANGG
jgi:hypothetical protein